MSHEARKELLGDSKAAGETVLDERTDAIITMLHKVTETMRDIHERTNFVEIFAGLLNLWYQTSPDRQPASNTLEDQSKAYAELLAHKRTIWETFQELTPIAIDRLANEIETNVVNHVAATLGKKDSMRVSSEIKQLNAAKKALLTKIAGMPRTTQQSQTQQAAKASPTITASAPTPTTPQSPIDFFGGAGAAFSSDFFKGAGTPAASVAEVEKPTLAESAEQPLAASTSSNPATDQSRPTSVSSVASVSEVLPVVESTVRPVGQTVTPTSSAPTAAQSKSASMAGHVLGSLGNLFLSVAAGSTASAIQRLVGSTSSNPVGKPGYLQVSPGEGKNTSPTLWDEDEVSLEGLKLDDDAHLDEIEEEDARLDEIEEEDTFPHPIVGIFK